MARILAAWVGQLGAEEGVIDFQINTHIIHHDSRQLLFVVKHKDQGDWQFSETNRQLLGAVDKLRGERSEGRHDLLSKVRFAMLM